MPRSGYSPRPSLPLPLPQLRVLRLRYATPSAISGFLEVVNTPFLEELDISFELVAEGTRSTVRDLDVDILDLVERSGCEIRRLTIDMAVFNRSEELTAILYGLPSLTHLLLNNTLFDLWIFRNLRGRLAYQLVLLSQESFNQIRSAFA